MLKRQKTPIVIAVLLVAFLALSYRPSYPAAPLAPPTIFQESSPGESVLKERGSVLVDMKFLTVVFSIGSSLLVDDVPPEDLEEALAGEFARTPGFIEGISLEGITYEYGVVTIPYTRGGRSYLVMLSLKDHPFLVLEPGSQWASSERFYIMITEVAPPVSSAVPLEPPPAVVRPAA